MRWFFCTASLWILLGSSFASIAADIWDSPIQVAYDFSDDRTSHCVVLNDVDDQVSTSIAYADLDEMESMHFQKLHRGISSQDSSQAEETIAFIKMLLELPE